MNLFRKPALPEPAKPDHHVRWMIRRDMPEVMEIEGLCFSAPWAEERFYKTLRRRTAIGRVAEDRRTERVVGFMVYESLVSRVNLLSLAVMPAFQRRGIGRQMVEELMPKLSYRRRSIDLMIRETNLDGQLFFKAMGFRAEAVLRGEYDHTPEDAYLMTYWRRDAFSQEPAL